MKTKIIFAGLLGLVAVLFGIFVIGMVVQSLQQADFEKGEAANKAGNYPEAVNWYHRAAERGHAQAQVHLGNMYYLGVGGVAQDVRKAVHWYHKAVEQDNVVAQRTLGSMYVIGKDIARDTQKGMHLLHKAAEHGDAQAQVLLGLSYDKGIGVNQDSGESLRWYRKAAEQGDAEAQKEVAKLLKQKRKQMAALAASQANFEKGLAAFKAKDYRAAFRWLNKAARQGHAIAQNQLGDMYYHGEFFTDQVVKQDHSAAFRWYSKAAEQGVAAAQFNLGAMYSDGKRFNKRGVTEDNRKAVRWYLEAAEQGHTEAQFWLGSMYQGRKDLTEDYVQAHKWLNISSTLGLLISKKAKLEVEEKMTAQQIAEARKEATEWLEAYEKRRK